MKKLFLSLFVTGALTFGLQSCDSDPCEDVICDAGEVCDDGDCVPDVSAGCEMCGTYNGTIDGNVNITGVTVPPISDEPATVTVTDPNSDNNYTVTVVIGGSLDGLGLSPSTSGPYNPSTKTATFTNTTYTYDAAGLDFLINGTAVFDDAGNVTVDVVLTSPPGSSNQASGDLIIVASK